MNRTISMTELVQRIAAEALQTQSLFFSENAARLGEVAEVIAHGFQNGRKLLIFGNGGSAADAQHIACELVGRFVADRQALPAISLSTDTSLLTAISNDYGFQDVFARQIQALGQPGDTALAISTSGNSINVLRGIQAAKAKGMYTVGLTGGSGGKMNGEVEVIFRVPSRSTPRIQEVHIMAGHVLCQLIETLLFPNLYSQE